MCKEHPDSYLNKVSQLNENPIMRYLHTARSALTFLRHLNSVEQFLTSSERHNVALAQKDILNTIDSIKNRVVGKMSSVKKTTTTTYYTEEVEYCDYIKCDCDNYCIKHYDDKLPGGVYKRQRLVFKISGDFSSNIPVNLTLDAIFCGYCLKPLWEEMK